MTDVGVKGLDLYCLQKNGSWRFVNSARPAQKNDSNDNHRKYRNRKKGNLCFICRFMMEFLLFQSE